MTGFECPRGLDDGSWEESKESRLLVAGDWHGNDYWASKVLMAAEGLGASVLLQLGDFGIWGEAPTASYLDRLEVLARRSEVTIYAIGGNHEDYDLVDEFERHPDDDGFVSLRPHVRWIPRGHRWEWAGMRFGALGGAFSIDWRARTPGFTWWPGREELQPAEVDRLGGAPLDVLVCHEAPFGFEPPRPWGWVAPEDEVRAQMSRRLVLQAIQTTRPKLVFHGHWHVRSVRWIDLTIQGVRVEGLAGDDGPLQASWGILDVPSLEFWDGTAVEGDGGMSGL